MNSKEKNTLSVYFHNEISLIQPFTFFFSSRSYAFFIFYFFVQNYKSNRFFFLQKKNDIKKKFTS